MVVVRPSYIQDARFLKVNENACAGEIGSVSLQSSSPKHKARHSVAKKKLDLDRVAELAPS